MNRFKLPQMALTVLVGSLVATQVRALDSGWKLSFDAGPTWVQNQNIQTTGLFTPGLTETTKLAFQTGYRLDLDAGYQFCGYFTLEEEIGYINNPVDISSPSGSSNTQFYQVPLMTDAVFTLPWLGILKPYAGAGLGVVYTGANDLHDVNGAGQLMAGLKCGLPAGIDVGIGYKLLVTTEHDWGDIVDTTEGSKSISQSVLATVSIKF
jgi:opacity protein-like surface antigen